MADSSSNLIAELLGESFINAVERSQNQTIERLRVLWRWLTDIGEPPHGARLVTHEGGVHSGLALIRRNQVVLLIGRRPASASWSRRTLFVTAMASPRVFGWVLHVAPALKGASFSRMIAASNAAETWAVARARFLHDSNSDVIEAFDWFDSRLGPRWRGWGANYPFAQSFLTSYNHRSPEGVRLQQVIGTLEDGPALTEVLTRVGSDTWDDHYTALAEVEAAGSLQSAGVPTKLVPRDVKRRTPDFVSQLARRAIEFECVALVESEPESNANEVMDFLFRYPVANRDNFRSSICIRFDEKAHAIDAFRRLKELESAVVEASAKNVRLVVQDLAVVEPISDGHSVGAVIVDGALTTGSVLRSLVLLGRSIRGKLKKGQLKPDVPGVLFVRAQNFSFLGLNNLEAWLHAIAEAALDCLRQTGSKVSAVVVYERWRGAPDHPVHVVEPSYTARTGFNEMTETNRFVVLVHNPDAAQALGAKEVSRLMNPRIPW